MPTKADEWLLAGPYGSFSMGNVDRVPRRKYHGLWISRVIGKGAPEHLLMDVIERQIMGACETKPLVNYDFGENVGTEGRDLIKEFVLSPLPHWRYELSNGRNQGNLTRTLRPITSQDLPDCFEGVELEYLWEGAKGELELSLEPLFTVRDVHALTRKNIALDGAIEQLSKKGGAYRFQPYGDLCELRLAIDGEHQMELQGSWYKNFHYSEEKERGYPNVEDAFCPARFTVKIKPNSKLTLKVYVPNQESGSSAGKRAKKPAHVVTRPAPVSGPYSDFYNELSHALEKFVYSSPSHPEREMVIAGYPWFSAWARDTFVTLPGLSLSWNDAERALKMLEAWVPILDHQLFGTPIAGEENDLNATGLDSPWLWAGALRFLLEQHPKKISSTSPLAKSLIASLERWVLAFFQGENRLVQVTDFGLLCKPGNYATSWMDALVDGVPVTPRFGYPININSLFFDSIDFLLEFNPQMKGSVARTFKNYLQNVRKHFAESYWVSERAFVADGHDGSHPDCALRPNQLWALSARFQLFSPEQARASLDRVTDELLTPFGLRTLSPRDSRYKGTYRGTQPERDHAYHQGTVWPWLLGKYTEAILKHWGPDRSKVVMKPVISSLQKHFYKDACLEQISEIFDGDAPHIARGAPAQAWSAAEVLRAIWLLENSKY